jgi:hypothetical protein
MSADPAAPMDREAFLKMASYPLVRQSDMSEETRIEAIDICTSGAPALAPAAPELRAARPARTLSASPLHATRLVCPNALSWLHTHAPHALTRRRPVRSPSARAPQRWKSFRTTWRRRRSS